MFWKQVLEDVLHLRLVGLLKHLKWQINSNKIDESPIGCNIEPEQHRSVRIFLVWIDLSEMAFACLVHVSDQQRGQLLVWIITGLQTQQLISEYSEVDQHIAICHLLNVEPANSRFVAVTKFADVQLYNSRGESFASLTQIANLCALGTNSVPRDSPAFDNVVCFGTLRRNRSLLVDDLHPVF